MLCLRCIKMEEQEELSEEEIAAINDSFDKPAKSSLNKVMKDINPNSL